jgi:hypothetical protein
MAKRGLYVTLSKVCYGLSYILPLRPRWRQPKVAANEFGSRVDVAIRTLYKEDKSIHEPAVEPPAYKSILDLFPNAESVCKNNLV